MSVNCVRLEIEDNNSFHVEKYLEYSKQLLIDLWRSNEQSIESIFDPTTAAATTTTTTTTRQNDASSDFSIHSPVNPRGDINKCGVHPWTTCIRAPTPVRCAVGRGQKNDNI